MRTGPFSDPTIVTLINRYFVPFHMDNDDWSEARYGIEPGEENAYLLMETPDLTGVEKQFVLLGRLSQVLEPKNARAHIVEFLEAHPEFHQSWPELSALDGKTDRESTLRRAELLLEEGRSVSAHAIVAEIQDPRAALLRARAYRLDSDFVSAAEELRQLSDPERNRLGVDLVIEEARIAADQGKWEKVRALLEPVASEGDIDVQLSAENYFLRGFAHHRAGEPERAIALWLDGIEQHPPETALFSQKAYFTVIRANWDLPENVDQPK